jgi:hypothetical protein
LLWGEPGRPAAGFGFSAAGVEPVAVRVRARTVPERLKPDSSSSDCGTVEQAAEKGRHFPKRVRGRYRRVGKESNPLDNSMAGAFATCCGVNLAVQQRVLDFLRQESNRLRSVFGQEPSRSG